MARKRRPPGPRRAFPVLRRLPRLEESARWQRLQTYLSGRILDVAEAFPRADRGPLHGLQAIRDHQRRRSQQDRARSRPPDGSILSLLCFEVVELFEIEDLGRLERALLSMFPISNRFGLPAPSAKEAIRELRSEIATTKHFSASPLGMIAAPERYSSYTDKGQDAFLSPRFTRVSVYVTRALPSLYALSFTFYVSDAANAELARAQTQEYLPRFRFPRLLSTGFGTWSEQSTEPPEATKLAELRDAAKRWVARYARGVLQRSPGGADALAVVDVFRIVGVPEHDAARLEWIEKSRHWLDGIHIGIRRDALHDGDGTALLLNRYGPRPPPALLLLGEDDRLVRDDYGRRAFSVVWSVSRYLESIEARVGSARQQVFQRLRRARWRDRDARTISKLNELLFLTRRLQVEITQHASRLDWMFDDVPGFKGNELYWTGGSFRESFKDYIQREISSLEAQLTLLRGSLSDQVAAQNLFRMYWLQITVMLLAVLNIMLLTRTGQEWMRHLEIWLPSLFR